MPKSAVTVTIETDIIEEARRKAINISEAAEAGIAQFSGQSRKVIHKVTKVDDLIANGEPAFKQKIKNVMENPKLGAGKAVQITKRMTGTRLSLSEMKEFYNKIKGGKHANDS